MLKFKDKLIIFISVTLLCCFSASALCEEVLPTLQTLNRAKTFAAEDIPQEDLDAILQAGVSTVTHLERQSWQFVAITDQEVLDELAADTETYISGEFSDADDDAEALSEAVETVVETLTQEADMSSSAVAIIIYADESSDSPNADFDCGLACQNMILAADAMGYGSTLVASPLNALNGDNHDSYAMRFGVGIDMKAAAVLLVGVAEEFSDAFAYSAEELVTESVSYIR